MHRYTSLFTSLFGALLLALLLAPAVAAEAAATQTPPRPQISAETLIKTARAALAKGMLDDAEFLLKGVKPGEGNIDDLDFLHGTIALARRNWQDAIARFRAMLARNPDLPRVRLDLALAYFQAGRGRQRGLSLPALRWAQRIFLLSCVRGRFSFSTRSGGARLGRSPDRWRSCRTTIINAATSARLVDLFGLPARLSEDARQTSGVGLSANISGGYEARISPDLRLRVGGGLRTRTYRESEFNDRILSLRAGPRFLFEKFDLRPELTSRFRWLGGESYSRATGVELSSNWLIAPGVAVERLGRGRADFLRDLPRRRTRLWHASGPQPRP